MEIFVSIRGTVVVSVMGSPPQWPSLCRRGAQHSHHALCHAACRKCLVGEGVAMVEGGDRKHADKVRQRRHAHRHRGNACP